MRQPPTWKCAQRGLAALRKVAVHVLTMLQVRVHANWAMEGSPELPSQIGRLSEAGSHAPRGLPLGGCDLPVKLKLPGASLRPKG